MGSKATHSLAPAPTPETLGGNNLSVESDAPKHNAWAKCAPQITALSTPLEMLLHGRKKCPSCYSRRVRLSKSSRFLERWEERFLRRLTLRRIYRCEACTLLFDDFIFSPLRADPS